MKRDRRSRNSNFQELAKTRPLAMKVEFKRGESTVKIAAPAASPAVIGPVGSDAR